MAQPYEAEGRRPPTEREREGERGGGEIQRICNPLLPSKLEMEKPLTRTQQQ